MSNTLFSLTRRAVAIGGLAALAGCVTAPRRTRAPLVLFVCEHGTVKSPIAREHLRRIAAQRGQRVRTMSRGINPSDDVSPKLAAALAQDGIDPRREPLLRLTMADLAAADVVVTFQALPSAFDRSRIQDLRDWSDIPGMNDDYWLARGRLMPRIEALLDDVATSRQFAR
ncbi:hypothetical protein ACFFF7_00260 [Novosphingobium aquiterrae]|uniref:Phosphotyrosine protein phosphatase I domain-containing protein n=1 Tax=Novosphingobium aquiterrae TaxID=624388 RepID=A0ABV6PDD8_9SPHN